MQLKYIKTVVEAKVILFYAYFSLIFINYGQFSYILILQKFQEEVSKVLALAWSPNNLKLAVCNYERIVYLFDENGEKKDKFPTKPADPRVII